MTLVQSEPKAIKIWTTPVKEVYVWTTKVRPSWPDKDYLCFTAEQANSTIKLQKNWNPTAVTLETSTDWSSWSTYTFGSTITLSNIWDKVYWRNTSGTDTKFSLSGAHYYYFVMTWSIDASWDINFLLNSNSTTTTSSYCYCELFVGCSSLRTTPQLLATNLGDYCYYYMFQWCTSLTTLPLLPAIQLPNQCYSYMFWGCSNIKLSTSKTWIYQTAYRIPAEWTWTNLSRNYVDSMFKSTWWTWTWTPSINTTYYTSNTVV